MNYKRNNSVEKDASVKLGEYTTIKLPIGKILIPDWRIDWFYTKYFSSQNISGGYFDILVHILRDMNREGSDLISSFVLRQGTNLLMLVGWSIQLSD